MTEAALTGSRLPRGVGAAATFSIVGHAAVCGLSERKNMVNAPAMSDGTAHYEQAIASPQPSEADMRLRIQPESIF